MALAARGDYAAGLAQAQHPVERAEEANDPRAIGWSQISLAQIYWHGGTTPRVLEASRVGMQAAEQVGDRVTVIVGAIFGGWAESRLAQHAAAAAHLAQAKLLEELLGGRLAMSDRLAVAEAEIALNRSNLQEALLLAEQAVAQTQAVRSIYSEGMAQRVRGQALARLQSAEEKQVEEHLVASLSAFEAGEARLEAAHTHLAWGRILNARGNNGTSRVHFEQAPVQVARSGLAEPLDATRWLIAGLQA